MGLRYRKSIKIAKGVRLNVSSKSVGVSVGGRGARISTNTRTGTRATVGIPGTGVSYSTKIGGSSTAKPRAKPKTQPAYVGAIASPVPQTTVVELEVACPHCSACNVVSGSGQAAGYRCGCCAGVFRL